MSRTIKTSDQCTYQRQKGKSRKEILSVCVCVLDWDENTVISNLNKKANKINKSTQQSCTYLVVFLFLSWVLDLPYGGHI